MKNGLTKLLFPRQAKFVWLLNGMQSTPRPEERKPRRYEYRLLQDDDKTYFGRGARDLSGGSQLVSAKEYPQLLEDLAATLQ